MNILKIRFILKKINYFIAATIWKYFISRFRIKNITYLILNNDERLKFYTTFTYFLSRKYLFQNNIWNLFTY